MTNNYDNLNAMNVVHDTTLRLASLAQGESVHEFLFSSSVCFRTHRSVEVFCAKHLSKQQSRKAHRIIQALIHEELNHGTVPSGDDFT